MWGDNMKRMKRHIVQISMLLLLLLFCNGKLQQVKAETVWNTNKTMTYQDGDFTFYAYPNEDKNEAWIYYIEVTKNATTQMLVIPEKMDGMKVTKLDATSSPYGKEEDAYTSLFRTYVDPQQGLSGSVDAIKWIPKLTIPSTVQIIGKGAFSGMKSITEVTLPESIKEAQEDAFYACAALKQVTYPKKCKEINPKAFEECWKIEKLVVAVDNPWYQSKNDIIYNNALTKVIWVAPAKKSVKFVATTKEIKPKAFLFSKATKIVIPKALTKFSTEAMYCPWLSKVEMDAKNTTFGWDKNTLYEKKTNRLVLAIVNKLRCDISEQVLVITRDACICGNETGDSGSTIKVHLPSSLQSVGEDWINALTSEKFTTLLYVHAQKPPKTSSSKKESLAGTISKVYISKQLLPAYDAWFTKMKLNAGDIVTYFEGETVYGEEYTYILGEKQARIIKYNGEATQVKVPDELEGRTVTEIAKRAFYKGTMETITLPNTVNLIEEEAFAECKNLYGIALPASLKSLGRSAFYGCKSLEEVELPDSLTVLEPETFYGCAGLGYVKFPAQLKQIMERCFSGCKALSVVKLPEGLEIIDSNAFSGCNALTEITIPDSVNRLGSEAFKDCKNLRQVVLSTNVSELFAGTFENCTTLTKVSMRPTIQTVYQNCFKGCRNLRDVGDITIVGTIYANAFMDCSNLEATITLGEGCNNVEENAFLNCKKATILVETSRLNSGNNAFLGCHLEYK